MFNRILTCGSALGIGEQGHSHLFNGGVSAKDSVPVLVVNADVNQHPFSLAHQDADTFALSEHP